MRPLRLIIQAFGPFKDKIEIPFENLGISNIYLISGVTGSGKTTIFDAICYALFNTSSGQNRGTSTLKSHFSDDKTQSFVEFSFLFNNEKYTIIRYPSFERKKSRGEGTILEQPKAQIHLPNGKIIEKAKEVDEYIIELLGINSSQFTQIALLAQGEFLKLLNTDTQNRAEIFRNIFKTWDFARFSDKLKNKMIEFKNEHANLQNSILQYINDTITKDEALLSLKENYIKNHCFNNLDDFCALLENQNKLDNQALLILKKETENLEKEIKTNQEEFLKIQNKLTLETQLNSTKEKIKISKEEFLQIEKEYKNINSKKTQLENLAIEINKTKNDYQKALDLKELLKLEEIIKKEIQKQDDILNELNSNLNNNKINHLKSLINKAIEKEFELKKTQEEFLNLQKETNLAKENYDTNYNEYLKIQAGILAKNLKENSPCPVCGSKTHPNPAQNKNENLTKEFINFLKESYDKLNLKLIDLTSTCSSLNEQFLNFKKEIEAYEKNINLKLNYEKYEIENTNFEQEIKKTEQLIENKTKEKTEKEKELSSLEAKLNTIKKDIKNANIDEILEKHQTLEKTYKTLDNEIKQIENSYNQTNLELNKLNGNLELLENQLKTYKDIDLNKLDDITKNISYFKEKAQQINQNSQKIITQKSINENTLNSIKIKKIEFEKIEKTYLNYKILSDCANGNLSGKAKIPFEQYIQGYYFDMVLFEANKRLKVMTNNQFQLLRKKDVSTLQSKTALDLEVMDFHTFKKRSTKTLSGGESFKAALSLALGLSDCISNFSGSINIDAMFIDEGFGSLDSESLELAMDVIFNLSTNNKLIGIISHIDELKSKIQNQITAIKTQQGSNLEINF